MGGKKGFARRKSKVQSRKTDATECITPRLDQPDKPEDDQRLLRRLKPHRNDKAGASPAATSGHE